MMSTLKKIAFQLLPEKEKQRIWMSKVGKEKMPFDYSFGFQTSFYSSRGNTSWTKRSSQRDGHEPGVVKWLVDNKNLISTFYDIGGSFGFFSATIRVINPNVSIHAFEPSIYFRTWLHANLKDHPASRWKMIKKFAGSVTNRNTTTLDDYSRRSASLPDVIKMDVDGAETEVLKGSSSLMQNGHTIWLIEVHPTDLPKFHSSTEAFLADASKFLHVRYLFDLRTHLSAWSDEMRPGITDDFFICLYPEQRANDIHW